MKNIRIIILFAFLLSVSNLAWTQPPPPSRHGEEGDQPAQQDAPIGSGLAILLALGGAYGAAKVYKSRRGTQES